MTQPLDLSSYRQQIEAALGYAGGTHTFEDVEHAVAAGRMQAWPGPASIVITEILTYPQLRAVNFFLAGGRKAELEAMAPIILRWARTEEGCTLAQFTGRKGWERTFLSRTGWQNTGLVTLVKHLDGQE